MKPSLTTIGKEIALLSEEVLARVAALRERAPLTTYRILMRCTLRSGPKKTAPALARFGPRLPDGKPRLVLGRPTPPGWVEVVEEGSVVGYIKAGALRALPARVG